MRDTPERLKILPTTSRNTEDGVVLSTGIWHICQMLGIPPLSLAFLFLPCGRVP